MHLGSSLARSNIPRVCLPCHEVTRTQKRSGGLCGYLLGYSDDNPMTFSSGEELEKAREESLKKLQNSDTAELKLSYRGENLVEISEKISSRFEHEQRFLDNFLKLEESDKTLIRYLTEKLVKDSE